MNFLQAIVAATQLANAVNSLISDYQAGKLTEDQFLERWKKTDFTRLADAEAAWQAAQKAEQNKS